MALTFALYHDSRIRVPLSAKANGKSRIYADKGTRLCYIKQLTLRFTPIGFHGSEVDAVLVVGVFELKEDEVKNFVVYQYLINTGAFTRDKGVLLATVV